MYTITQLGLFQLRGAKLIITCSSNSNKPFNAPPPHPEAKYFVNNSGQNFFFFYKCITCSFETFIIFLCLHIINCMISEFLFFGYYIFLFFDWQ